MLKIKNKIVDMIGNSSVFIITLLACILTCVNNIKKSGNVDDFFVYFTTLSNILVGLVSLMLVIFKKCPQWLALLRYVSIVSILIVFLVVMAIFTPVIMTQGKSIDTLYHGSNFWFHLINPLIVIFLFFFNEKIELNKKDVLFSLIPFVLYSIFYIIYVLILHNKDIYSLTNGYKVGWALLSFLGMYLVAMGVSIGTYSLKRKIDNK